MFKIFITADVAKEAKEFLGKRICRGYPSEHGRR